MSPWNTNRARNPTPNVAATAAAGTAIILSTHLLAEVTAACDRVAILHEGQLRYDGPIKDDDHRMLEQTFFDIAMRGNGNSDRMHAA